MNSELKGNGGRNSYWKNNWKYIAGIVIAAAIVTLPKVIELLRHVF